jgi:hypothetical protein
MGRKRYTPEQIISMFREAQVLQIQGIKKEDVCRKLRISTLTFCGWRKEDDGMRGDQIQRVLKSLGEWLRGVSHREAQGRVAE